MINPRILLLISTPLFLFFFLIGMIRGNAVITILSRSIAATLVLTLLTAVAAVFFRKIDASSGSDSVETGEAKTGRQDEASLDIVLEDENPYSGNNRVTAGSKKYSDDGSVDLTDEDEPLEVSSKDFIEEVEEESLGDIEFLDTEAGQDEIVEVMNDNIDINEEFKNGSLPEIDNKSLNFGNRGTELFNGKHNDALDTFGNNIDAGTMAKAIKTILTRDQKG